MPSQEWPALNCFPDQGSDGRTFAYYADTDDMRLNFLSTGDVAHGVSANHVNACKASGDLAFMNLCCVAFNAVHYPWNEARFWQILCLCVREYFRVIDLAYAQGEGRDPVLEEAVTETLIMRRQELLVDDAEAREEVRVELRNASILGKKNSKCSMTRLLDDREGK